MTSIKSTSTGWKESKCSCPHCGGILRYRIDSAEGKRIHGREECVNKECGWFIEF